MQSQGSTSSQPSFDSMSSGDSLLCSDSEQAEDDTEVFLMDGSSSVVMGKGAVAAPAGDRGSDSPGSQWTCDGFTDKEEESESESGSKAACVISLEPASQIPKSHGDLLFAQKCAELQGFVRPLLELLNGLKNGRFDRGLSSFQQSIAMDRIRRIVGVLQRPHSGEKYLNTLLQVEMMLKLWFPQISAQPASSIATSPARSLPDTSSSGLSHKHKDQSHIPVKKRRLSWTGTNSSTPSPVIVKCPRISGEEKRAEKQDGAKRDSPPPPPSTASDANPDPPDGASSSQPNEDTKGKDCDTEEPGELSKYKAGHSSEPSLTWVHVAPIPSPRKACPSHEGPTGALNNENQHVVVVAAVPAVPQSRRRGRPAMQDCSISSTTTRKHPKNYLNKPAILCPSEPVARQQSEGENNETCRVQNQSPLVTLKPLPSET